MTTITVSPSTHARLVNDKTLELRSIEKVILDLYDRVDGNKPNNDLETLSNEDFTKKEWNEMSKEEQRESQRKHLESKGIRE